MKFFRKYFYYLGSGKIETDVPTKQIIEWTLYKKNLLAITNFRQFSPVLT